uniref:Uncharacterized protein n=1 Tax=Phaeomonas parva TaxID=124430 RepID=A0A7S1XZ75_9STRA|mmetsp:Transcript_46156/g.144377  ORF Transcript_46156/g.144377 Transcript_46156/m.144377 type:complete len:134 (+) Transcript_46156:197-598(+)
MKGRDANDCGYVLVASGTSYYVSTLFLVLEPHLRRGAQMVAFDFIAHDREYFESTGTNVVGVKMRKGYLDRGAVVIERRLACESAEAKLVPPRAPLGKSPEARDFHYVKWLSRLVPPARTVMVHQALLVLQGG